MTDERISIPNSTLTRKRSSAEAFQQRARESSSLGKPKTDQGDQSSGQGREKRSDTPAEVCEPRCEACGALLTSRRKGTKFCHSTCRTDAWKRRQGLRRDPEVRNCLRCGEPFEPRRGGRYCSSYCKNSHARALRNATLPGHDDMAEIVRSDPCAFCGIRPSGVDHIEPLGAGGALHPLNVSGCCVRCNASKKDRPLLAFLLHRTRAA